MHYTFKKKLEYFFLKAISIDAKLTHAAFVLCIALQVKRCPSRADHLILRGLCLVWGCVITSGKLFYPQ